MDYNKGIEVKGTVKKVETYGIFLTLENDQEAFLPKEEMYINKKKKLTDIFVVGYAIKAKIKSKKKDYYVLTQKNGEKPFKTTAEKNDKSKTNKKTKKQVQHSKEKRQPKKNETVLTGNLQSNEKEIDSFYEKEEKQITLDNLRNMTKIGNLKIYSSKKIGKSLRKTVEKKEVKEILEVPDNFMNEIIANFEKKHAQFEKVLERIKGRGWLNEN